ncbi:hypothetical protein [Pseudolysinimonas sp.]|jgi:hypothetical protein|uniref:hypothetical protein n=1 Tax=Pseudolysinimonas sp. TaxID=2680009 RepID=UPI0037843FC9
MRRPLLLGLIAGGLAFVILVVVGVVLAVSVLARNDALADLRAASTALAEVVDESESAVAEADDVIAIAADPLLPVDAVAAVTAERDAAADALEGAGPLLTADPEPLDTDRIRALSSDVRAEANALRDDDDLVRAALLNLAGATRETASTVENANFSAENLPHLAFRDAVADLALVDESSVAESLLGFLDAAHALEASHAEEIAEKAGPLLDRRLTVEEFARSIAGGVLLEFDWAVTVNGYGTGGSYGGTSYWQSADGGYATITLSDSVATMWPGAGVQSLVVHEVGHAILSKCTDLFFGTEYESGGEEPWATAWAIGMGYTADGNGESIYGRPSDALIQLSTQCR